MTNLNDRDSDAYATGLLESGLGMFRILSVYLGDRLGLYSAMQSRPGLTAPELADATGCVERYVREWLEQQAVAGLIAVSSEAADASERRYSLSPAAAEVLTDGDSLNYMAPISRLLVSLSSTLPELMQAFRTGGGVSWTTYGEDARVASPTSTARPSSAWPASGLPHCRRSMPASGRSHPRASPISVAAAVGRPSVWRVTTRWSRSMAMTSTRRRSTWRRRTSPVQG